MPAIRPSVIGALLLLSLTGCNTGPMHDLVLDEDFAKPPPAAKSQAETHPIQPVGGLEKTEEPSKEVEVPSPPKPRTVFQAVQDYCRCLRSPKPPPDENKADGVNANGNGKKEQPPNGDSNGKDTNEKKQAAPPAGDQTKSKNGDNGAEKEKDKNGDDKGKEDKDKEPEIQWYSAHAQATMDAQYHGTFHSPYVGPNSLQPRPEYATSLTATLFLDYRLWECDHYSAEFVFNPEIAGGRGFSNVNGIAGFTNGDITRVGVPEPTPYFARVFLRQTWGLGGEQEKVEDEANQIAGKRDIDRFTLTAGKFTFTDVIDNNTYSHDPRTQMQNWSMMYNGAWDYPANVRGYSYGLAMELNEKCWALRYAVMAEPAVANGALIDPRFTEAFGQALEWEKRWNLDEHPGRARLMGYLNRAHMGSYAVALDEQPVDPVVTATRAYRYKYGFGLNVEQELRRDLGFWLRLGWSDGQNEAWAYTPIDRTAALGLLLKGTRWERPNDTIGLGAAFNGLATTHRDYLSAGGLDFSIGDGRLNYGTETILEFDYRFAIIKGIYASFDFQEVFNPAYNRDRGPVSVESLLVHLEF